MAKESRKPQHKPTLEGFQEETRKRAEDIYKQRTVDNKPGDSLSDWLRAEKEVKKKYDL
jgi:hypothetical protein